MTQELPFSLSTSRTANARAGIQPKAADEMGRSHGTDPGTYPLLEWV